MTKGHHKTACFTVRPDSIEEQNETKLTTHIASKESSEQYHIFHEGRELRESTATKCFECGLQSPNYIYLIMHNLRIPEKALMIRREGI